MNKLLYHYNIIPFSKNTIQQHIWTSKICWAKDTEHKITHIAWFYSHKFQQAKQIHVGKYGKVVASEYVGWRLTRIGHKGTFWNDGNVLYLALGRGYVAICNHQTHWTEHFKSVHFVICKLCLTKIYIPSL